VRAVRYRTQLRQPINAEEFERMCRKGGAVAGAARAVEGSVTYWRIRTIFRESVFVAAHGGFSPAKPRRSLVTRRALFICFMPGKRRKDNFDHGQQCQTDYCEKNNCAYNTDHRHAPSALIRVESSI
jgi:hypothetical protein